MGLAAAPAPRRAQGTLRSLLQTQGKEKLQLWSFQSPLPTGWIWAQLSRPHGPWSVLSGCLGAQKLLGHSGVGGGVLGVPGSPLCPPSPAHLCAWL